MDAPDGDEDPKREVRGNGDGPGSHPGAGSSIPYRGHVEVRKDRYQVKQFIMRVIRI